MNDPKPIIECDVEFFFTSGNTASFTIVEGRDVVDQKNGAFELRHSEHLWEQFSIDRSKVDYAKMTRRVVQPEQQVVQG